jgi:SpoIIAA-like
MIEALSDMPPGTIGFRATGHLTRDDYRDVLEPALEAAVESGEVRLVYAFGPEFETIDPGAFVEDSKVGVKLGIEHWKAWQRTAIVTDSDWMRRAIHAFTWMTPGEVRVFGLAELDAAKQWAAA